MNKPYSIFHDVGSAGNVRGKQVAKMLGAKLNPKSGFENDTCIYVKVRPPEKHPKNTYMDVDDATEAVKWLKSHRDTGIIVNSKLSEEYLAELLDRDDIHIIPHIHCNYEKFVRPKRRIKTVGIIGSLTSFKYPIEDIQAKLKKIGLTLYYNRDYWKHYGDEDDMTEDQRRMKVVDFYKKIDIQIVWRPDDVFSDDQKPLKNPNKLINAGSFGIPTVAYPEQSFLHEWNEQFIHARTIKEMIFWVKALKENGWIYNAYSLLSKNKADEYHLEKIRQLYLQL